MGRKIILLSDGTGNSSAKVWRTNVWRTFEALDLSGSDQVALYDDGVGTSSFKPLAILGGAFGFGLRRKSGAREKRRRRQLCLIVMRRLPPLLLIGLEMRVGDAQFRHWHFAGVATGD